MSETPPAGHWSVIDKNARHARRTHEAPSGARYALDCHEPTYMKRSDAMVFLRDPAFEVRDEHGEVQRPLPASEAAGERSVTELQPDECVARYDELSTSSLLARVAARPGGNSIDSTASRERLIAFLSSTAAVQDAPLADRPRRTEGEADDIDTSNPAFAKLRSMDDMLAEV